MTVKMAVERRKACHVCDLSLGRHPTSNGGSTSSSISVEDDELTRRLGDDEDDAAG